ncbi:MAG: carbohydrate ABC transporter permease [Spirochaetota bacterium]
MRINKRVGERIRVSFTYALATLVTFVFMLPIVWTISGSFKTAAQFSAYPPVWLPDPVAWANYLRVWKIVPFALYFFNSLLITIVVLFGRLVVSSLVAYGFSRFRFPGRDLLFLLMLSMIMLPQAVTLLPEFLIFKELGWNNTFLPLVVPALLGVGTGGAFTIFAFRQYFMSIPMDFDEAARIDGIGPVRIYWEIIVPLSRPAFAAVVITSLPVILLFLAAQDHFVRGMALGGLKG